MSRRIRWWRSRECGKLDQRAPDRLTGTRVHHCVGEHKIRLRLLGGDERRGGDASEKKANAIRSHTFRFRSIIAQGFSKLMKPAAKTLTLNESIPNERCVAETATITDIIGGYCMRAP